MIADQALRNSMLELSREPNSSAQLMSMVLKQPDWTRDTILQLRLQQTIIQSRDVDSAILLLRHIESFANIAFDFNEIMTFIIDKSTAQQAYQALVNIQLAPSALLQEVILTKGDTSQHIELMKWQLSQKNMDVKLTL